MLRGWLRTSGSIIDRGLSASTEDAGLESCGGTGIFRAIFWLISRSLGEAKSSVPGQWSRFRPSYRWEGKESTGLQGFPSRIGE